MTKNKTGWIKGRFTLDADGNDNEWNGQTRAWDEGLAGQIVELLDHKGKVVATSKTNSYGEYMFDVPAGSYRVKFPKMDGFEFSKKDSGVDDHYDSDADSNGLTDLIKVKKGKTVHNVDAGVKVDKDCVLVAHENYEKNAKGWWDEWRKDAKDHDTYLGGFGHTGRTTEDTGKTFHLPDHTEHVVLTFDFLEIDSWDGERFYAFINGHRIDLGRFFVDSHYGNKHEGSSGSQGNISWTVSNGYSKHNFAGSGWSDERHEVKITIKNPGDDLKIGFGSSLNQHKHDESWGVDNLKIIAKIEKEKKGSVEGRLFEDTDHDNTEKKGNDVEPGIKDAKVQLLDEDGDVVATTTTRADGSYKFDHVKKGDYRVKFFKPDGTAFVKKDVGPWTHDSDANSKGITDKFHVSEGEHQREIDAGVKIKNRGPDAKEDCIEVHKDEDKGDKDGNVLANDHDPDGDTLKVTGVEDKGMNVGRWVDLKDGGRIKIEENGDVDFDADGDFDHLKKGEIEKVHFTYDISDGKGGKDWVKSTIKVEGKSEDPMIDELCTFRLMNHPDAALADPGYGLRLDNVFGPGEWTFDFEADQSGVFMTVDPDAGTVRIFGTVVGGRDVGSTYEDPSVFKIDFTYTMASQAGSDDDLWVAAAKAGNGSGTISKLDDEGNAVETKTLTDKAGSNAFSFRLGDGDDDTGHRGFDGKSGWGWFNVNGKDVDGAQDWIFAVEKKQEPVTIEGRYFNDNDKTDTETAGDTGVDGKVVLLLRDGVVIDRTTTDDNGEYKFEGVAPNSTYQVAFENPDGGEDYVAPNVGPSTTDSDAEIFGGDFATTAEFSVGTEDRKDVDAGIVSRPIIDEKCEFLLNNHRSTKLQPSDYGIWIKGIDGDAITVLDFEADGAAVFLLIDGDEITIKGVAIGRTRQPDGSYEDAGAFELNFKYGSVEKVDGDDDLIIKPEFDGDFGGTISKLDGDGVVVETFDYKNKSGNFGDVVHSLRLGDGFEDMGGPWMKPGKSVDAWLSGEGHTHAGDFHFTLGEKVEKPICINEGETDVIDIDLTVICDKDEISEGDLVYSLRGPDADLFNIDAATGEITFKEPPDFENPQDQGADNEYNVVVRATATVSESKHVKVDFNDKSKGEKGPFTIDGVTFSAMRSEDTDGLFNDAMIFDAAKPTGGDNDLKQPAQQKVLIISEDGDSSDPDDEAHGGMILAEFASPATVKSLVVLDTEEKGGTITLFDADGDEIATFVIPRIDNGDLQTIDLGNTEGVASMKVTLKGSGAIDDLKFLREVEKEKFVEKPLKIEIKDVEEVGSISGRYFCDVDADGVDDGNATEFGIGNALVELLDTNGDPVLDDDGAPITTTTNPETGVYRFTDVPVGDYIIRFADPASDGKVFTTPNNGPEADDSDVIGIDPGEDNFGQTGVITVVKDTETPDVDAGAVTPEPDVGSISGRYFCDVDADGVDDGNLTDLGIGNALVELLDANGNPVLDENGAPITTTTNPETGVYRFVDVPVGSYIVRFADPASDGKAFVPPNAGPEEDDSDVIGIEPGEDNFGQTGVITVVKDTETPDVDAGAFTPPPDVGSISGRYFCDVDADGVDDGNLTDLGIGNALVELLDANGNPVLGENGAPITTTTNPETGVYRFTDVPVGDYIVRFADPTSDGKVFTTPNNGPEADDSDVIGIDPDADNFGQTGVITVEKDTETPDVDAGAITPAPQFGNITGRVFLDENGDGRDDGPSGGEEGVPFYRVELLDDAGNPVLDDTNTPIATTTNEGGLYSFMNIPVGDYIVRFEDPRADNLNFTTPNATGVPEADDSDVTGIDPTALDFGQTDAFELLEDQTIEDLDAGLVDELLPPPPPGD